MKNAYAKEQAELRRQLLNYGALVGQQFNVDMMCLALNEEGFGHDRIMRIIHRAANISTSASPTAWKATRGSSSSTSGSGTSAATTRRTLCRVRSATPTSRCPAWTKNSKRNR